MDSRFMTDEMLRGLYEIQLGLERILKKFDTLSVRSSSPAAEISQEDGDHTKMSVLSDPSTKSNDKHEDIANLVPNGEDVLKSDSELSVFSNLGVQSLLHSDLMTNPLSTSVSCIQAPSLVLLPKVPDSLDLVVFELIQINDDPDLVVVEVFLTVDVVDLVKKQSLSLISDGKSRIRRLLQQIDESLLHPLTNSSKVLGVQQTRDCSGVQLLDPPDLRLFVDNFTCCVVVWLPPWPPPSSPPLVFILNSTYLCLGYTSMSCSTSLVIVAVVLGKMTMVGQHASRGDRVVNIMTQHWHVWYNSSISEHDNLDFKWQIDMNKASFTDHRQTSTLSTSLGMRSYFTSKRTTYFLNFVSLPSVPQWVPIVALCPKLDMLLIGVDMEAPNCCYAVGNINYRDDILAFLIASCLVTLSCLREARAAVVYVRLDGSGAYIDIALQAFDDMLLRGLECLTALVLHKTMKSWAELGGCLAFRGTLFAHHDDSTTMQFGATFGNTGWLMHLALPCTFASLSSLFGCWLCNVAHMRVMRWIGILAWSSAFILSHILLIGFMIRHHYLLCCLIFYSHLEDKVDFKGGSNDKIPTNKSLRDQKHE